MDPIHIFRIIRSMFVAMLAVWSPSSRSAIADEPGAERMEPSTIERVDRLFVKWDKPASPGAVLAILKDGKIIYSRGYGMANLEENVPNVQSTVFHLASVSKQFTAFAIYLLADDGKLSLDDDVRKYIPELHDFGKTITIRELLHHTSGIRDQWNLLALAGWRLDDVITDDDVRRILGQQKELNFPPGDEMLYSNSGYSMLALVVRRVSGVPLSRFAKDRIFVPLGMTNTHYQTRYGAIVQNRAYSYLPNRDGGYRYIALSYSTIGPSSLFSTVADLARWDENFYTAQIGGKAVLTDLQTKGTLNNGKEIDYASGLVIGQYRGLKTVSHAGADAGYRTNILRFPDYHFSVIVLANAGDLDADGISLKVADICLEDKLAPAEKAPDAAYPPIVKNETKLEPEALDAFTGDFELEPGFVITFTKENGMLFQQATGQSKFPIFPSSANSFFLKVVDGEYVFDKAGADGKVHTAALHQNGRIFPLTRIEQFSLTPDQIRSRKGTYYSEELGVIYTIRDQNGNLIIRYPRGDIALKQTAANSFAGEFPVGTLTFSCDQNDDCKGFEIDDGRVRNLKFVKVDLPSVTAGP
jgi:CubicO group peptidase (beta-lactamase class C family)